MKPPLMHTVLLPRKGLLVVLLATGLAGAAPNEVSLWGTLPQGPHAVGFRTFESKAVDLLPSLPGRPTEIALWYPAKSGGGTTLRFEDYFKFAPDLRRRSATRGVSPEDLPRVLSAAMTGDAEKVSAELLAAALAAPLRGVRDAEKASGRFPIVIWSSRYGTTAAQCVLSEFLASHGFLVAFARPKAEQERLPFETKTPAARADELENQTRDMKGALIALRSLPEAAPDAVVIAWSYAGESAVHVARSDARVVGVIGLSTNTTTEWVYGRDALGALEAGPLDIPFSSLTEEAGPDGAPRSRKGPWSSLPNGSLHAVLPELRHGSFNVVEGLLPAALGLTTVQPWSRAGAEARLGYEAICRLVLAAVRAALARNDAAVASVAASLDAKVARVEWKPGPWPTRIANEPVTIASANGVAVVADLYRAPTRGRPCLALFHQSGGSRGEYRGIAPHLAAKGFTSLAVDLRWGRRDRSNQVDNETARAAHTEDILASGDRERRAALSAGATADMRNAVAWLAARDECRAGVIPWGSSSSANRVLELAASGNPAVRGVVAFSPGEYDSTRPEALRTVVRSLEQPALIVWGRGEAELAQPVLTAIPEAHATGHASTLGFHGSSILYEDPAVWPPLLDFLNSISRVPPRE